MYGAGGKEEGDFTTIHKRYMERERISISTYQPYMDFHARVSERYGNKSLRILDIGSGNGAFIDACVARGHDILGIEYDTRFIGLMPEETAARVIFEPVERALPLGPVDS